MAPSYHRRAVVASCNAMKTVADFLSELDDVGEAALAARGPAVLVQLVKDDKIVVDVTPLAGFDVDRARDITLLPVYELSKQALAAAAPDKPADARIAVGRSRSADVNVQLERLSKIHAHMRVCSNGDLEIQDAGSKNGTFIGANRVDAGEKTRVKDGSTLHLGPYPFRFFTRKTFASWLARARGNEGPTVTGTVPQRVEIIGPLGRGGMADVLLARRIGPGGFKKEIALKRLLPEMAHDKNFVDMFLQEARIAARISHPNVVQIFDLGWDGQRYFIAMEYVPGWNLALIQRGARRSGETPIAIACHIGLDLCAGLKAAHSSTDEDGRPLRIIHRDVSPQNVLVSVDGTAKLSDFGVSRAADSIRRTKTGELKGKLAYMAPEQLEESLGQVDHKTDIFAAAATIYECFVGFALFRRGNDVETMQALLHDPIPDLR
ncbi:MAG TPA: FHA domain-containing serine/threonine-protein kinase, partial [Myxococcota bacterium]